MSKVYLAIPGAPDVLLGHVEDDGRVYLRQVGPDNQVGRVNLSTGEVYEQRFLPDKKVGHVDQSSGRVYATRLGPDTHMGQVNTDGRMRLHRALAADDYAGRVDPFRSYAHTAGALLLLVAPAFKAELSSDPPEEASMN